MSIDDKLYKLQELRRLTKEEKLPFARQMSMENRIQVRSRLNKKLDRLLFELKIITAICHLPFMNNLLDLPWKRLTIKYIVYAGAYDAILTAIEEQP